MSRRVYVVANTGHDYSAAKEHGELVYMYEGKVNVFASDKLCRDVAEMLRDSQPEDFLITSGNQVAACVAFAYLMAKHGVVNVLIHSFRNRIYEVRTIRAGQVAG